MLEATTMEGCLNYTPSSADEPPIIDVKPLRCLAPLFPAPFGFTTCYSPNAPPSYVSVTPFGPFPPGFVPLIPPSSLPTESHRPSEHTPQPGKGNTQSQEVPDFENLIHVPSPSTHTPQPFSEVANGGIGPSKKIKTHDVGETHYGNQVVHVSSSMMCSSETEDSYGKTEKRKGRKRVRNIVDTALSLPVDGDRESVERILMTFDALRRRLLQLDDVSERTPGISKRSDLKAGAIMMSKGIRVNEKRRIGAVPGVEIGDLFFFRFEMCLVGLHSPSMAGIDYMNVKFDQGEDAVALSIVSSGMYEDDDNDTDVLIYSGQGGSSKVGKQIDDQKLERGNLALEKSSHRKNEIRVIRGMKDLTNPPNKIYVYDGIYKIHESWIQKGKSGFSVFKYKLLRVPGQPDGSAVWKLTQQWKGNPSSRSHLILPDISSGSENLPICLVNDADKEKGPSHFLYVTSVKYLKPISSMKPLVGCTCHSVCMPGDGSCCCAQRNGGYLPYSSNGLLIRPKTLIYECGTSCQCSLNCRNRVSQMGIRFHFEIFKTRNRGWGLRTWDPIRAGSFICEYTGEVVDKVGMEDGDEEDDYVFEALCPGEACFDWNNVHELVGEEPPVDLNGSSKPLSIIISAKNTGNISRFMNHSCSPNVFWQPILYDHGDECYPHIIFYAMKHIPPMTELTFDYGLRGDQNERLSRFNRRPRKQKCLCGSEKCKGFFG